MAVTLHAQCPVTEDQALTYLQDQGYPADGGDLLRMHLNAVIGQILLYTGRSQLVHVSGTARTEYARGSGESYQFAKDAPIQKLTTVTLYPHQTTPEVITGPGTSLSNDDVYYDRERGKVVLKSRTFPAGIEVGVSFVYEAGYTVTDPQHLALQMLVLEILGAKWAKWSGRKHGIVSETRGQTSVTYSVADFSETTLSELKLFRRNLFA